MKFTAFCDLRIRLATHRKSVHKFWFWKLALTCVDLRVRLARALPLRISFCPLPSANQSLGCHRRIPPFDPLGWSWLRQDDWWTACLRSFMLDHDIVSEKFHCDQMEIIVSFFYHCRAVEKLKIPSEAIFSEDWALLALTKKRPIQKRSPKSFAFRAQTVTSQTIPRGSFITRARALR